MRSGWPASAWGSDWWARFALARLLESQLYGVALIDPVVFAGAALLLAAVAVAAALLPALRAARTDPMAALRWE